MLIFVYGSLKKDFPNHYLIENSKFLGKAITVDKFSMFKHSCGNYPCLSKNPEVNIFGELFDVELEILKALDYFEGVPHFYYRDLIQVSLGQEIVDAWVYFFTKQKELTGKILSEWI